ncbi:L-threonylcarbamoyladenylate synthase [Arachidicoccus sp.]|uniref:L-threonylcarbamoyladenylate synthase n=1 Tax=Arachidicoccus sp. TaxID=1872624 RepID=UPI003D228D34
MSKEFEKDVVNCLNTLHNGEVILYPTDTVWGLGCDATNEAAVQKIIEIKNRPANKSFVVLVESKQRLQQYVKELDKKVLQYLQLAQKPTTVVYENAIGLAPSVVAVDLSIAIRICADEFCKEIIRGLDKPLLSTSANKSGEPSPRIFREISNKIAEEVDYIVKYRQDDERIASPSTIVKWENSVLRVIRE